jgi:hypothetical protein
VLDVPPNRKYAATRIASARERVHRDRAEQHREPAALVAQHTPQDAAEQQPTHLHVEQVDPLILEVLCSDAEVRDAAGADHREQDQVVDVDEVPQRGNDHGQSHGAASRWGVHAANLRVCDH